MNTSRRQAFEWVEERIILYSAIGLICMFCAARGYSATKTSATAPSTDSPTFTIPGNAPAASDRTSQEDLGPPVRHDEPVSAMPPINADAESSEYPLGRGTPGIAVLGGGAFNFIGHGVAAAPTLALRYYFQKRDSETEGPEALSPWSVEVGGSPASQALSQGFKAVDQVVAGTSYRISIHRLSEAHIAAQYQWAVRWPLRLFPELALGIDMMQIQNGIEISPAQPGVSGQQTQNNTSFGPLLRAGLPLIANDWLAIRIDAGYMHFANNVSAQGNTFNLGLSGFGLYPTVQISLGYLHSEVQKGVYLPPSALPLWAISALQTEKRSPIIAPPEVLLNSHQAATQGGLSGNVLFQYKSRGAQKVELLADFNHWTPEPMYLDSAHVWVTVKDLKAGPYHYVYLVNGKREIRDPWNTSFDPSRRVHGVSSFVVPEVTPTF